MSARALLIAAIVLATRAGAQAPPVPEVLFRLDDAGLNSSVNAAIEKVAATGMPISVSVLFVGPSYKAAVAMLQKFPKVAVGVHLALNAEWREPRWGPVLGAAAVPSLVDSAGNFPSSRDEFLKSQFDPAEVEREITAQVERAIASGLKISYVDAHMATLEATPALREIEARVAKKYGLGVSKTFGESVFSLWDMPVAWKGRVLMARLSAVRPDSVNTIVVHAAERTAEMNALFDLNAPKQNTPEAGVGAHRGAELEALLSPEVVELIKSGKVKLVTYRELVARAPRGK